MNIVIAGLRSKLTTIFGSIPGVALMLGELMDVVDSDPATVFDWHVFISATAMALAFFFAGDANKTAK